MRKNVKPTRHSVFKHGAHIGVDNLGRVLVESGNLSSKLQPNRAAYRTTQKQCSIDFTRTVTQLGHRKLEPPCTA